MSRALPQDLDCIIAVELVTDYLEGVMPADRRVQFEEHLVTCPGCVGYLQQIRAQIRAARAMGESRPPAEEVTRTLLAMFRASRGK
jgi:predicted anti-sigma-YlaC factor YlaD